MYLYIYIHVLAWVCCVALLVVCLTLLASFFLPFHLSLTHVHACMYVLYTHLNVSGVQEELVPLDGQLGMLRSLQHYYGLSIPPAHCADAEHDPPTADTIRTHKYTYMYMYIHIQDIYRRGRGKGRGGRRDLTG